MKRGSKLILSLMLILLCSNVLAFGAGCQYTKDNPMTLYPGETEDFEIVLSSKDQVIVTADIIEGGDIASIRDRNNEYQLPQEGGAAVNVRVSIPNNTINPEREIKIRFTVVGGEGGVVGLKTSITRSIPIKILGNITEQDLIENKTQDTSSDKEDIHLILNKYSSRESLITATIILLTIIAFIFWIKYNPKNKKSLKKKRKKK